MLTVLILALIFILAWWFIYWIPLPPTAPAFVKPILYCILILFAIYEILRLTGVHL